MEKVVISLSVNLEELEKEVTEEEKQIEEISGRLDQSSLQAQIQISFE